MYRIYIDGYFVGIECLTSKEVADYNNNGIVVVAC